MTDSDITLTRLEVRTGDTPDWLYLHAETQGPWAVEGRLWALFPLVPHLNYRDPQTHFDPNSPEADTMGGAPATGTLHLDCGCSRQVTGIGSEEECDRAVLIVYTGWTDIYERVAVGCLDHSDDYDPWRGKPDPLETLSAPLTHGELTAIRNAIVARRDDVAPMALAGLYGAAGVRAVETRSLDQSDLPAALRTMAALRGGIPPQADPAWFRVR